ncbi:hypothetical protein METHPM2_100074 [Pseudomonas sp. PM2]
MGHNPPPLECFEPISYKDAQREKEFRVCCIYLNNTRTTIDVPHILADSIAFNAAQ